MKARVIEFHIDFITRLAPGDQLLTSAGTDAVITIQHAGETGDDSGAGSGQAAGTDSSLACQARTRRVKVQVSQTFTLITSLRDVVAFAAIDIGEGPAADGTHIHTGGEVLMKHAYRKKLRIGAAVVVTGGVLAMTGTMRTASGAAVAPMPAADQDTVLHLNLTPMPQGTVRVGQGKVEVSSYGFTPGSAHTVELRAGAKVTVLGTLQANGVGQANASFGASGSGPWSLLVLNAGTGTPPIAITAQFGSSAYVPLLAVEPGVSTPLQGTATIVYNAAKQTITATLNASGFSPGRHAAHIHLGSCQAQGPVIYMFQDFTANTSGYVTNETRVVTGATTFTTHDWYFNTHQGTSANILTASGQPTIYFRPLLCSNLAPTPTPTTPTSPAPAPAPVGTTFPVTGLGSCRLPGGLRQLGRTSRGG